MVRCSVVIGDQIGKFRNFGMFPNALHVPGVKANFATMPLIKKLVLRRHTGSGFYSASILVPRRQLGTRLSLPKTVFPR